MENVMADETLSQALARVDRDRWSRMRSGKTLYSQAKAGVTGLHCLVGDCPVQSVTPSTLAVLTAQWYKAGTAPATIQKRLNCLSALGVNVEGCRVKEPKVLKWWLRPEDEERLVRDFGPTGEFALFVRWTTRTGLRVEETLALTWGDFVWGRGELTVPGTKTDGSQATIVLSSEALEIAQALFGTPATGVWNLPAHMRMVRTEYTALRSQWQAARQRYGWETIPTATLKALRRTAARYLHVTCGMPLDIVRQYLRHEDIKTTLGYLRLTGGYSTEEMRKYLR